MSLRTKIVLAAGMLIAAAPWVRARQANAGRAPPSAAQSATAVPRGPAVIAAPVEGFDPLRLRYEPALRRMVSPLAQGGRAVTTLEPTWQRATLALLARHAIPRASVVVLDTATGRVLVYASRGLDPREDVARDVTPPAASVFKIVTASALLTHGLAEQTPTCWSGGFHGLRSRDLVSNPRRDRECSTLPEAFAHSTNAVFARRAVELLRPDILTEAARQWGFNEPVPFDAPVPTSELTVPTDTLGFARTAAGFWNSHLSPLHGALLAQGVALQGEMLRPWMVERVEDARGRVTATGAQRTWRRAVSPETAWALGRAMFRTVSEGTARGGFHDPAGRPFLDGITVGGKTGTLTAARPYTDYTWFVGNADGAGRRLSFAVMVANGPLWRVRAATLARQVMQIAFRGRATD